MPIHTDFPAVSVVCLKSLDAEGFSTTLLALGPERSRKLMLHHPEILRAYFIDWNGTVVEI